MAVTAPIPGIVIKSVVSWLSRAAASNCRSIGILGISFVERLVQDLLRVSRFDADCWNPFGC
jgi:hypothetical protein